MTRDLYEAKKELVIFLRNNDVLSTTTRGVTTKTDTGTFTNASTFTLSTSPTAVKNVRSVTIATVLKTPYTDYTVNYDTGVITFTSQQNGAYSIIYDYGSSDKIFPDFPQSNLKLNAFPRIAVDIIGGNMKDIDLGAITSVHSYNITVVCYSTDVEELEDMTSAVLNKILANKKTFYYFKYITPSVLGPILNSPGKGDKVLARNVDFVSTLNYETN